MVSICPSVSKRCLEDDENSTCKSWRIHFSRSTINWQLWLLTMVSSNSWIWKTFEAKAKCSFTWNGGVHKKVDKTPMVRGIKIQRLWLGERIPLGYGLEFSFLACDIPWKKDLALMDQFKYGLQKDVGYLLLIFQEVPRPLTKAISWVLQCDNNYMSNTQRI